MGVCDIGVGPESLVIVNTERGRQVGDVVLHHGLPRSRDVDLESSSREARLALLNIKTDNKTISQIYFTVKYI